jgi:hypothetical protein
VYARHDDSERARPLIERAHEELADAPAEQGIVWLAHALTELPDDINAASPCFERAIDALVASSMQREAAEVCREWSQSLTAAGRRDEAAEATRREAELREQLRETVEARPR